MEIVLLQTIKSLGRAGDVKKVKRGYAINYLIPQKLALPATEGYIKEAKSRVRKVLKVAVAEAEAMGPIMGKLKGLKLAVSKKASRENKLFGSIKKKDVVELIIKAIGDKLDEKYIDLSEPIKKVGLYNISVRVSDDLVTDISLEVKAEEENKK